MSSLPDYHRGYASPCENACGHNAVVSNCIPPAQQLCLHSPRAYLSMQPRVQMTSCSVPVERFSGISVHPDASCQLGIGIVVLVWL